MDHDAVGSGLHVGAATRDGVIFAGTGDERLATGKQHEILRNLRLLAHFDLVALVFDRGLLLHVAGFEERVLLEPDFVLDDDGGNAEPLQRTDEEHEVLGETAGVAIVNDGLGGNFQNVVDRAQARGDVHRFVVRLALERRVG